MDEIGLLVSLGFGTWGSVAFFTIEESVDEIGLLLGTKTRNPKS